MYNNQSSYLIYKDYEHIINPEVLQKDYNELVAFARSRASSKDELNALIGYSEAHHIIPRCLEGTDDLENIVHLTPEEHYTAHQILMRLHPTNQGLINAAIFMTVDKYGHRVNNILYGWIKREFSNSRRGKNKYNDEGYRKNSETQSGRSRETYEPLAIMGDKRKGWTKENHEGTARMAEKLTGRSKETHEHLAEVGKKMSIRNTGQTKENSERVRKMAETRTGRTKANYAPTAQMAEKLTGRTKEIYESLQSISDKLNKLTIEQRQFLVIAKNMKISFTKIHKYFEEILPVHYSTITQIYHREKNFILTSLSIEEISKIEEEVKSIFQF